jgi:hypothetical protein
MQPLLKALGIMSTDERAEYARARARALSLRAALDEIDDLENRAIISRAARTQLEARYRGLLAGAETEAALHAGATELDEQLEEGAQRLALIERTTLRKLARNGLLDTRAAAELEAGVIERLAEHHTSTDSLAHAATSSGDAKLDDAKLDDAKLDDAKLSDAKLDD